MKKPYSVYWSRSAEFDLESIVLYIARTDPMNAGKVLSSIKKSCSRLAQFPNLGKIPPELEIASVGSYRELVVAPWRIIYRMFEDRVFVLAVLDSRRDIDDALLNRLVNR